MTKEKKDRTYCFTLFCEGTTKCAASAFELKDKIRYLVWQQELCPKTKKEHYQGYLELTTPMRLKAVKDLLGYIKVHLEGRKGSRDEARGYCMKSDTQLAGPWELGSWDAGGSGKRKDLDEAAKLIREKGLDAVADQMPGTFIRMQKHLREYETYIDNRNQPLDREMFCFWVHGPTNIGKSHLAYNAFNSLYALCPGTGQNWYDGYNKEKVLLIDDLMANTIPACDMLHIADKWRYRCPIKGGFSFARWNVVVVTCNSSIYSVYAGTTNILSIIRRFKLIPVLTRKDCEDASIYIKKCVDEKKIPDADWDAGRGGQGNTGLTSSHADCPLPISRSLANFAYLNKFN